MMSLAKKIISLYDRRDNEHQQKATQSTDDMADIFHSITFTVFKHDERGSSRAAARTVISGAVFCFHRRCLRSSSRRHAFSVQSHCLFIIGRQAIFQDQASNVNTGRSQKYRQI